ncbi:MAG: RagB/SusD family nutrient uptake outer membrane protein [Bacteroidetes bacterium]|nr:MAG: RagB/SusD family nutrient uptake outer membrane protein [Bacteroidota bacterium]
MIKSKYFKVSALLLLAGIAGCTKLNESYTTTVPINQAVESLGPQFPGLLLTAAYNDIPSPFVGQDQVFSLEENSTDESLVPTRGGDWDDNGVWRVVHNHTWNADHSQVLSVYNNLNKLNFDATNVLQFNPSPGQKAEARFLRALSLYFLLDIYGQFPFRNPGDNLLLAPKVYTGDSAVQFIISELNAAMPDLDPSNGPTRANQDAAKVLLMRLYLNRGAFINRATPTFDDADMTQVITLGQQIMGGKYSYMANYFDNFSSSNGSSSEAIFAYPASSGVSANNPGMDGRWMMTFHYNEYDAQAPNAGWNGFSTISDFYNAFGVNGTATTFKPADTALDSRLGGRVNSNLQTTLASGIRPGFLVGQQHDQNGVALKDRKGNPLAFDPNIAANMIETGSNLEVTGIRVAKYVPDFSDPSGKFYSSNPGNWLMLMRYPEVALMVAEAKMRSTSAQDNAGALKIVNDLRKARGAAPLTSMTLVNAGSLNNGPGDPNTLLAERGRELYWESLRRTDLIRFGVFLVTWQYKPSDDPKYLLFPVPNQALAVNPNLKQNPGY